MYTIEKKLYKNYKELKEQIKNLPYPLNDNIKNYIIECELFENENEYDFDYVIQVKNNQKSDLEKLFYKTYYIQMNLKESDLLLEIYLNETKNIIGFSIRKNLSANKVSVTYIDYIYVLKEFRKNRIGKQIFQNIYNIIKEKHTTNKKLIILNVLKKNKNSLKFFENISSIYLNNEKLLSGESIVFTFLI